MVLTSVTAVGRHHQVIRTRVLHDVLPMDGVGMAKQLVLVHVHTPMQNF